MVPKRIFYCWLTKDESSPGLPTQFNVAINQWKSICKPEEGWEYILVDWDYMKSNYGDKVISRMRLIGKSHAPAVIADYCRLVVTTNKGGFYLDLDSIISPKFLDLVDSAIPIISARPHRDLQFMCHPGSRSTPLTVKAGLSEYTKYLKLIVGNFVIRTSSNNINYVRSKADRLLYKIHGRCEIVHIHNCTYLKTNMWEVKYFYFNQPIFHFDFGSHNGDKLGFESEFNDWKCKFLDYYKDNHD